jgi:hypothetical protein
MATPEEIAALRLLIAEPDNIAPYTDAELGARLDVAGATQYSTAYHIWNEKAAGAANLVDISEGGSSRKMGDVYEQFLSMAERMRIAAISPTDPPTEFGTGIRVRKLTRP